MAKTVFSVAKVLIEGSMAIEAAQQFKNDWTTLLRLIEASDLDTVVVDHDVLVIHGRADIVLLSDGYATVPAGEDSEEVIEVPLEEALTALEAALA